LSPNWFCWFLSNAGERIEMKLHLGSGRVNLTGWLNVDLDAPEADMHLDLRAKLPFEDQSVTHIYNEHFIEHITREEALSLLKECHRVLRNDGVFRLSTPNLKFIAISYLSRSVAEWGELWKPANPCFLMNEALRLWGHQFVYDAEELTQVLTEAGFDSVQFVKFGESSNDELVGLETRPFHNELIVEARKDGEGIGSPCGLVGEYDDNEPWIDSVSRAILTQIKLAEKNVSSQTTRILKIEAESATRAQYILELEGELAARAQYILNIEGRLAAHSQRIDDLVTQVEHADAVMSKSSSSWLGKLLSAIQKLRD
jgi:predicted SAM-dependent methyltransferase